MRGAMAAQPDRVIKIISEKTIEEMEKKLNLHHHPSQWDIEKFTIHPVTGEFVALLRWKSGK